ncbi:MAG: hypothetical protein LBU84_01775 [Prevotella sp.]|jgi:uncharacterized membrane protein|nr:hypothetical protein [Prevotella sp.]
MRLTAIILLFTISMSFYGQAVFLDDEESECIFIGSVSDTSVKVWNKNKQAIEWKTIAQIGLWDHLQSTAFTSSVFDAGLSFHAEGDEPFWGAEIKKDSLIFVDPDTGNKVSYKLKIDVNDFIDNSFSFMFSCNDENIYGLVRGYSYYPKELRVCELCICEEISLYEVFIIYKGHLYKGCAKIETTNR